MAPKNRFSIYDDVIENDPAYQGSKPVDAVNDFFSKYLGQPVKEKLKSKEQALLEAGELIAKPFSYVGQQISSPDVTLKDLQKTATTDQGLTGLKAQAQMPFEALGETLQFVFDPNFYSDLRAKINRGEATGFDRGLGVVSALGEIAGGDELARFAIKKFGPGIKSFFDNLNPQEKADPISVINKMPISKQQKVELGQEILGGGKTVENVQSTIMRAADDGGAGGPSDTTKKFKPNSMTKKVYEYVMSQKNNVTKQDIRDKFNLERLQLNSILNKNPELNNKIDIPKQFYSYDFDKLEDVYKKIKKGELEPNLGFNSYGLDKQSTALLLRDFEKFPTSEGRRSYDTSKLKRPVEEYRKLIPYYSKADQLRDYLRDFKGTTSYKDLQEKFNISYGNTVDAVYDASDSEVLRSKIQLSKYGTPTDKFKSIAPMMNKNKEALGLDKAVTPGGGSGPRPEFLLFDGLFRSIEPEFLGLSSDIDTKAFANKFVDYMKNIDWKTAYADDLASLAVIDAQRVEGNKIIREMFNEYKKKYPKKFKGLSEGDFLLQVAHNFPLRVIKGQLEGVGGVKGAARLSYARTNVGSHGFIENTLKDIVKAANEQGGKLTPIQQEVLAELDQQAKKLGTVAYASLKAEGLADDLIKVGVEEAPGVNSLITSLENYFEDIASRKNTNFKKFIPRGGQTSLSSKFVDEDIPVTFTDKLQTFEEAGSTLFKKGGAVRKAIGGTLENINQQNFTPDPAIEGDSAFQQAVKDENLVAFNPTKIFKFFKDKIPGVYTPSKTDVPPPARDINTNQANLPAVEGLQDYDFALKSFTVDKIQNSNTKAAKPQDWINELQGGNASPSAELQDSGLFQYMADFERYYPNQRMTKEQLINFYEQSPIANLQVKVKASPTETPYGMPDQEFMGRPQHQNAGSASLDEVGTNYREIVISAGKLPGEDTPFIASSHFNDPNVLVFSRVADYKNAGGDNVTVIQELQTDLLTNVRKEQERLAAEILNQKKKLQTNQERLQRATENNDIYTKNQAQQNIDSLQKTLPQIEKLAETGLIKPYPLTVAKELIPTFEKQMMDFQSEMQDLMRAGINRTDPEYLMKIDELQKKQFAVFEELRNLNRTSKFDDLTDGVQVPQSADTENLQLYAQNQSTYESVKDVTTFPPIPFNKQADYVDLILKATIKDAENRNINKIAIMPAEVGANNRWNKTGDAKKKFENLYDKVGVQQLKNIAKKYGGELNVEQIQDTSKGTFGVKYFNKGVDGKDVFGETDGLDIRDAESYAAYFDSRAMQEIANYGDGKVMVRREIAPGQFSEFILKSDNPDTSKGYKLVDPTGDEAVIRVMEEYNPSLVNMMVLTLPKAEAATKSGPMFMFRKKEGGIIPEDRLVSITDIYGDY